MSNGHGQAKVSVLTGVFTIAAFLTCSAGFVAAKPPAVGQALTGMSSAPPAVAARLAIIRTVLPWVTSTRFEGKDVVCEGAGRTARVLDCGESASVLRLAGSKSTQGPPVATVALVYGTEDSDHIVFGVVLKTPSGPVAAALDDRQLPFLIRGAIQGLSEGSLAGVPVLKLSYSASGGMSDDKHSVSVDVFYALSAQGLEEVWCCVKEFTSRRQGTRLSGSTKFSESVGDRSIEEDFAATTTEHRRLVWNGSRFAAEGYDSIPTTHSEAKGFRCVRLEYSSGKPQILLGQKQSVRLVVSGFKRSGDGGAKLDADLLISGPGGVTLFQGKGLKPAIEAPAADGLEAAIVCAFAVSGVEVGKLCTISLTASDLGGSGGRIEVVRLLPVTQ